MRLLERAGNFLRLVNPVLRFKTTTDHFTPSGPVATAGAADGQRVLFIPWYSRELYLLRETLMAKGCEWRGATTALLCCDQPIGPTEYGDLRAPLGLHAADVRDADYLLDYLHQDYLRASDYYTPLDRAAYRAQLADLNPEQLTTYEHEGVQLGDLVMASVVRTELSLGPEWNRPGFRERFVEVLLTGIELCGLFRRVYGRWRPDRVVMSHAIYVSWGVAFRVARQLNLPCVIYNGSYRKGTLRFYHNTPNAPFPEAEWPRFRDVPLTETERQRAETYFKSRQDLKEENIDLLAGAEHPERLQTFIHKAKEEGKTLAALFTNMSWDAYAFSTHRVFDDMLEWLRATIAHAAKRPQLRLIVKIHPAEDFFDIPERYRMRNHLPPLPDNVLLLTERDKVPPFAFYRDIDFGLINISTVAIEMAMLDIPVLTSGADGHYEHRGFTLSPDDRKDYLDKLDALIEGRSDYRPDRESTLRYLYYRFFREAIPYPFIEQDVYTVTDITIDDYDELAPGRSPSMDIITEGILHGSPFVYDPSPQV